MRGLSGCKIEAIGQKTAEAVSQYELRADFISRHSHNDMLAEEIAGCLEPSDKVWYLKAKNADQHLKESLQGYCDFEEMAVYKEQSSGN